MKQLTALSLSIAVLAFLATWLFLSVGTILIWAAFLAWACFYANGGDVAALRKTVVCNIFGCVMGWVAAVAILAIPLTASIGLPLWAAIVVGVTVFVVCFAANVGELSSIPASFYGYAGTFAFLLQTPGKLTLANLTSFGLGNAPIVVGLSLVIGAAFGYASAQTAAALTAKVAEPGAADRTRATP